jgi:hypothetical protein
VAGTALIGDALIENIDADKITGDIGRFGSVVINNITAQKGYIASLTVDELDTSDMVQNYLDEITDDVNYIHAYNEVLAFITATTDGLATVPVYNRNGEQLYWLDATHEGVTEDVTSYPVTIYDYDQLTKLKFYFSEIDGEKIPIGEWGAGNGVGNNGKAYQVKLPSGFVQKYIATGAGDVAAAGEVSFTLGDDGAIVHSAGATSSIRNVAICEDSAAVTAALNDLAAGDLVVNTQAFQTFAGAGTIDRIGPNAVRFTGTSAANVNMPTSPVVGDWFSIKNRGTATCTLIGTFDGVTNKAVTAGTSLRVQFNGSDWDVV